MKIALVCYTVQDKYQHPTVHDEDGPLLHFMHTKGLDVQRVVWDDSHIQWHEFDLVILKAPWDYHEKLSVFLSWIDSLHQNGVRVLNPPPIVKWNSDKHYLNDISRSGYPVIESSILEVGSTFDPLKLMDEFSTDVIVVKPCISAGAKHTYKLERSNEMHLIEKSTMIGNGLGDGSVSSIVNLLLKKEAFIVQPFVPEIVEEGEYSYVFFNGDFSHAILKKPRNDDFRVQHYHGGTISSHSAREVEVTMAKRFVDQFASGCLYARVDGIMRDGMFQLMELELIEPMLYFAYSHDGAEEAMDRYCRAVSQFSPIL